MKSLTATLGGLAGAIALNLVHETYKRLDHSAPRVDLIGEEALEKSLSSAGIAPPKGDKLYWYTLAADIASNTVYYSMIGYSTKKNILWAGAAAGCVAGIGAVALPGKMGLHDAPVTRTNKTKLLTIAWYTFGGLITVCTIRLLEKKN